GIDGPGQFTAILDAQGDVAAASTGFASLKLDRTILQEWVRDVRAEDDRLVKRRIGAGQTLAAGIARLTDTPPLHLLLVVDDGVSSGNAAGTGPAAPEPHPASRQGRGSSEAELSQTVRFAWRTDAEGR